MRLQPLGHLSELLQVGQARPYFNSMGAIDEPQLFEDMSGICSRRKAAPAVGCQLSFSGVAVGGVEIADPELEPEAPAAAAAACPFPAAGSGGIFVPSTT